MTRGHLYLLLAGILLLAVFAGIFANAPAPEPQEKHPAPDIALPIGGAGPPVHLSQWQGKVVVLDFWATWCGPCRQSIPELAHLYTKYHAQGLEVVGISEDRPESRGAVPQTKKELGITYPIVFADDVPNVSENYPHNALPTFYIIDRKGNLASVMTGLNPHFDMEDFLVRLLKEQPKISGWHLTTPP